MGQGLSPDPQILRLGTEFEESVSGAATHGFVSGRCSEGQGLWLVQWALGRFVLLKLVGLSPTSRRTRLVGLAEQELMGVPAPLTEGMISRIRGL
jgi:hypothetical protein